MKKVVHYRECFTKPVVGKSVICFPIDHPDAANVSNTRPIRTSTVVEVREDDEFETLNSIYRKGEA
jgi:hypothetical protein